MKRALLLFCALMAASPVFGQDDAPSTTQQFLKNSDLSDGTTSWHGDCRAAGSDSTTDFITSNSGNSAGITVELHSSSWTKVTQEIRDKPAPGVTTVTITYQVSPDFKLSDRASDYGLIGANIGFGGARIPAEPGPLVVFVDVPPLSRSSVSNNSVTGNTEITIYDDKVGYAPLIPATAQSPQTFTATLRTPPPTSESHQTFCIAFPPGSGSITFTKISLTPGQAGAGGMRHFPPPGNMPPQP